MATITKMSLLRKPEHDERPQVGVLLEHLVREAQGLADFACEAAKLGKDGCPRLSFASFERDLRTRLTALGRLVCTLFLALAEQGISARLPARLRHGRSIFRRAPAQPRSLNTLFGVVRYWRSYMRRLDPEDAEGGYHPTDLALGLSRCRTSFNLLTAAVYLAIKLSFEEARSTLSRFVEQPPSTEVIEKATLGLGRFTAEFFEQALAPAPDGADGEVLIIMVDSKGVPTATAEELSKRRGKRRARTHSPSKRHRGRDKRQRSPRRRRRKGDKSKNARMATQLVMYSLRREGDILVGPLNVFRYASLAPKRHAFEIAVREANKRGFEASEDAGFGSLPENKLVQVLVDGDPDLALYAEEYFTGAKLTIDVMHVLGYLHKAGGALFKDKEHAERDAWFSLQKERLYGGELDVLLEELREHLRAVPKTGPGTKSRRERLGAAIEYIDKRRDYLNYAELIEADLEITTGAVEGAVKFVIAKRFDHGGMRWIRERAEALLQLRCIEINGQWDDFLAFVHSKTMAVETAPFRLLQDEPATLPTVTRKAA